MSILLIGLSHKSTPIDIREQHALSPEMLRSVLSHFSAAQGLKQLADVAEGVVLSTCNRMEVYAVVHDNEVATEAIVGFLARCCHTTPGRLSEHLYALHNEDAVRHLMRVAAGLDSMVLGEPQILGQIVAAYDAALSQQAAGAILSALFRAAIHAGKRARTETAIGLNSASVSSVAANLATRLLGDLAQRRVLLIGAGEMGAIAVRALLKRGVSHIVVANRTFENAERLAKAWGGEAIGLEQLPQAVSEADIIIASTGAPGTILSRELVEPAMAARPDCPLLIIDIALPRDVDPDVTRIPNVHLRNIDDLQSQAEEDTRGRESEIPRVEMIVDEEVGQFAHWLSALEVVSTIADLRQQMEQWRQHEVNRLLNRLNLDARERDLVAMMSCRLVNKILHEPTHRLKAAAATGDIAAYVTTMRQLFSLDEAAQQASTGS